MGARILLIEDNADLLMTLGLVLQLEGHDVQQAMHGQQAQQVLLAERVAPDLIVLDLQMPVMDGPAFVQALPSLGLPGVAEVPRLVITASAHTPEWATRIIRKPFEIDTFVDAVHGLLAAH